ncbi:hypothetical protein QQF64_018690 [Cirrhinus molitorella]|uniref:Uncharacterized protein n=1 Tax=Cirrhinus molitorella TaxID=172907 RepID=A0ABR3LDC4_9TELE
MLPYGRAAARDQTTHISRLKSSRLMGTRVAGDVLAEPKGTNALRLTDVRWSFLSGRLLTDACVQEDEIPT